MLGVISLVAGMVLPGVAEGDLIVAPLPAEIPVAEEAPAFGIEGNAQWPHAWILYGLHLLAIR